MQLEGEEMISEGETTHNHVPLTLCRSVGTVASDKLINFNGNQYEVNNMKMKKIEVAGNLIKSLSCQCSDH